MEMGNERESTRLSLFRSSRKLVIGVFLLKTVRPCTLVSDWWVCQEDDKGFLMACSTFQSRILKFTEPRRSCGSAFWNGERKMNQKGLSWHKHACWFWTVANSVILTQRTNYCFILMYIFICLCPLSKSHHPKESPSDVALVWPTAHKKLTTLQVVVCDHMEHKFFICIRHNQKLGIFLGCSTADCTAANLSFYLFMGYLILCLVSSN